MFFVYHSKMHKEILISFQNPNRFSNFLKELGNNKKESLNVILELLSSNLIWMNYKKGSYLELE